MNVDEEIFALVAADSAGTPRPDLAVLRTAGRRRLLRRRGAVAGTALAVVAAVALPTYLVASSGDDGRSRYVDTPTSSPSTLPDTAAPPRYQPPVPGQLEGDDGLSFQGEWEDGTLLGTPLTLANLDGRDQILYAVRRVEEPDDTTETTTVAVGIRDGNRILRVVTALSPEEVAEPDGIDLYDGFLGARGSGAYGWWDLYGSVPGDHEITITGSDEAEPGITTSTDVLPGYTVFVVGGTWEFGWDENQAAPLTVHTDDGRAVSVRERSWTG